MIKAYASKKGSYWKEKRPIDIKGEPIIFKKKKQILLGLGGAITKASAYNYALLDEENKKLLLNLYYSSNGLDYNLSRLSIGSNDFSFCFFSNSSSLSLLNSKYSLQVE